jgi:hypothetical protein
LFDCDEPPPSWDENTVAYCDRCAWHGKMNPNQDKEAK